MRTPGGSGLGGGSVRNPRRLPSRVVIRHPARLSDQIPPGFPRACPISHLWLLIGRGTGELRRDFR